MRYFPFYKVMQLLKRLSFHSQIVEEPCFVLLQIVEKMMVLSIELPFFINGMHPVFPGLGFGVQQQERAHKLLHSD